MKKRYIALLSLLGVSVVTAASFTIGHSAWQYAIENTQAQPNQKLFSVIFKTSAGGSLDSLNYTGLEFDSYFETPHRSDNANTFIGWKLLDNSTTFYIDTVYKYSDIYKLAYPTTWSTYQNDSITLYEVWSA